jgi:cobalt/nickel transport system ATP-binding protein
VIRLSGFAFAYPGNGRVFHGLDFSMAPGERVALVGPNGAGKSTLMHVVMGILKPTCGRVEVFGAERRTEEEFREVRERAGFVFQDSDDQLFCPTVEEDVAFGPLNLGLSHAEAEARVGETCDLLGIAHLRKKVTHRLSGGEKRLAALTTVAAMRPELYVLDEPTAGLDAGHTAMILAFLRDHAPSVLLSSHDEAFLHALGARRFRLGDKA